MKARQFFSATSALCLLLVGSSQAETWNRLGGGTFSWNDAANWNPTTVPNSTTGIANLNVDIAANTIVTLASNIALDQFTIGDSSGTSSFTIGSSAQIISFGNAANVSLALLTKNGTGTDTIAATFNAVDNVNANITAGTLIFSGPFNLIGNNRLDGGVDVIETWNKNGNGIWNVTGNTTTSAGTMMLFNAGTSNLTGTINRYLGKIEVAGGTHNFAGLHSTFTYVPSGINPDGILVRGGALQFGTTSGTSRATIATTITQTAGTINIGQNGGAANVNLFAGLLQKGNGTLQLQNGNGTGTTNVLGGNAIIADTVAGGYNSGVTSISVPNTSSLYVGMRVYGPGIQPGTVIQSIGVGTITLSLPTDVASTTTTQLIFAEGVQGRSGTPVTNTPTINMTNTSGFAVGQTVVGAGIPTGAKVIAVNPGVSITIDTNTTSGTTGPISSYAPSTLRLAGVSSATNIFSGPGTGSGTVNFDPSINLVMAQRAVFNVTDNNGTIQHYTFNSINSEIGTTTLTLAPATPTTAFVGAKTVAGSNAVFVSTNASLAPGTTVSGPGIPPGARIVAVVNLVIFLDMPATATSDGISITFNDLPILRNQANASTITVGNYGTVDDRFDGRIDYSSTTAGLNPARIIKVGTNTLTIGGWEDNPQARFEVRGGTLILDKESSPYVHAVGGSGTSTNVTSIQNVALIIGDGVGTDRVVIAGTHNFAFTPGHWPSYMTAINNYVDQIFRASDVIINAGGILDMNGRSEGFNLLQGAGTVTNTGSVASTLILGENWNQGSLVPVSTAMTDGTGGLALIKTGNGGILFDTAKTYSGSTLVARGTLSLASSGALTNTSVVRVANSTLILDNQAANLANRIYDSADIYLSQGTLTFRNNTLAANSTFETVGDMVIDTGYSIIRFEHVSTVNNELRLHIATLSRVGGSQLAIIESNGTTAYGFGNNTTPNTSNTKFTVGTVDPDMLVGGGAASGVNQSILMGVFGGPNASSTNEFMVVQNIGGVNYIRPLIAGSTAEYTTLASGTISNGIGISTAALTQILTNTAMNSLRASGTGAIIQISDATILKLGGNTNAAFGATTQGAGMLIMAGSGLRILGGTLDFGIREANLRVNANALIASSITGTNAVNGLFKGGGASLDLLGNNSYLGETISAQGQLRVFHNNGLGATGAGNGTRLIYNVNTNLDSLTLGLGATIGDLFDPLKREDLVIEIDARFGVLNQNNVWNGNIILEGASEATVAGQNIWIRTREDTAMLTINGDVTGGGNTPFPTLAGAASRQLVIEGGNLREGMINFNGSLSDQNFGSAVNGDYEKLNILVRGSTNAGVPANEFHVNIRDAAKVHGQLDIQNGFVRLDGDWGTDPSYGNNMNLIMRVRTSDVDTQNYLSVLMLTRAGSTMNVPNIVWGDVNGGYSVTSYGMIGAEITSGVVTIGNGSGNLDLGPAADTVPGQSFSNSGSSVVAGTNIIDLGAFDIGFDVRNLRAGMLLTGTLGTGTFPTSMYILQVDADNNRIIVNKTIGTAGGGNIAITQLNFNDATTSTTTNQQYADARLYSMEGGELDIKFRLLDDGGFSLENEVGAVTKVGRGVVRLSGSAGVAGELDGGLNLHGGTLILDYTVNYLRKITSGANQEAPLTLAGGDLWMRGASGLDATNQDDTSIEELRGLLILRPGESLIRVQSGGVGNTTTLNLGPPSTLFQGVSLLPVRYAGGTMAFWRDTSLGGSSVITLELPDIYTGSVILPWAVYADETTGKIVDFAYIRPGNSATEALYVAAASSNGGVFALENGAQYFGDTIYAGRHGYYAETSEILVGEGSGFYGTLNLGANQLRALLFNIDNDNTSGDDFINGANGRQNDGNINNAANDPNNTLKIADGTTMVLVSELPGETGFLGGAILIANSVGNTNKTLTGGSISSGLETYYFDANLSSKLVRSYDLIVHNYADAPNFTNQALGGGIFTFESDIVDNPNHVVTPSEPLSTVNFVHSGTGWTKMYRASQGTNDGRGLGQGYSYTGSTYFNGGTVWVSDPNKLGATPGAFDADNFYFTGGRLLIADMTNQSGAVVDTVNSSITLDPTRGIMIGGDGAILDIANSGTTLTIQSQISVEQHSPTFAGGVVRTSNLGVGDVFKQGLGTLVIAGQTNTFSGLVQVKEGTLIARITTSSTPVAGAASLESTLLQNQGVLGSSYTFIDGTYVDAGANFLLEITGGATNAYGSVNGTSEWITLDGGTLGTTAAHQDGGLQGVIRVRENSTIDVVGNGILRFNSDAGVLTGSGSLTKTGTGTLHLYENSPEFTGNWSIKSGRVTGTSQGAPLGTGDTLSLGDADSTTPSAVAEVFLASRVTNLVKITATTVTNGNIVTIVSGDTAGLYVGMPVIGPNVPANAIITEVRTVNGVYQILLSANVTVGSSTPVELEATLGVNLPLEYDIDHDIIVNAEAAGAVSDQIKRIGAYNHDSYLNNGQNYDRYQYNGTITLNDDLNITYGDSTANTGITGAGRDVIIALNNSLIGAEGNDIRTEIIYDGDAAGNTSNDLRVTIELSGNNSAWLGDLIMGNATADSDKLHIVRAGSNNALSIANDVHLNFNNRLQVGGTNLVIGNLMVDVTGIAPLTGAGPAAADIVVENASNTEGTITINQMMDEIWSVLFRDGTTPTYYSNVTTSPNNKLNLTKAGTGTATLTQTNGYTGRTTIQNGTLQSGANEVIDNLSPIFVTATGAGVTATFDLNGRSETIHSLTMGGTTTTSKPQVTLGSGTLTLGPNSGGGGGVITYDATNNPLGGTITGGTLSLGNASRTFDIGNSTTAATDLSISSLITGTTGGAVVKTGAGVLEFSNAANSYTGTTTINAGVLSVNTILNGGVDSGIGRSASAATNLILNGGTLRYTGGATSTDRLFTLGANGGGIESSGTGAITFTNTGANLASTPVGVRTLTLSGTNTDANRINSNIAGAGTSATSVVKAGTGTWILGGNNTYVGTTTVQEGRLQVGAGGTATTRGVGTTGNGGAGQGATTVDAGAYIGGTGVIRGQAGVTNHVLNGTLEPGDYTGTNSGLGKLEVVGNLNASNGTLSFQLGGTTQKDATLAGLQAGTAAYDTHVNNTVGTWDGSVTLTTGAGTTAALHDFINVQGTITLDDDSSTVRILQSGGYTFVAGDIFDIMDWTIAMSGTLNFGTTMNMGNAILRGGGLDGDLELPTLSEGLAWDLQKFWSNGVLIVASGVVPEPSRALLLVAGLGCAILRRRRPTRK